MSTTACPKRLARGPTHRPGLRRQGTWRPHGHRPLSRALQGIARQDRERGDTGSRDRPRLLRRGDVGHRGGGPGTPGDLSYYFDRDKLRVERTRLACKSRTLPTIPAPIWRSRSTSPGPRSTDPRSTPRSASLKSCGSMARTSSSNNFRRTDPYAPVKASRFLQAQEADIRRWLVKEDWTRPLIWGRRVNRWAMGLSRGTRPSRGRTGALPAKRKAKGNGK